MAALSAAEPTWPMDPDHAVAGQRSELLSGSKLRSSVRVQDAASDFTSAYNGLVECCNSESGLHSTVDGVADDPVRVRVLDGAEIEGALVGAVLGDVGEPQLVRSSSSEVAAHEVVMGWRAGLGGLAALRFSEPRPPAIGLPVPPHSAVTDFVAVITNFIGEEPVAELGVVAVCVIDRVRQRSIGPVAVGDRLATGSTAVDRDRGPGTSP